MVRNNSLLVLAGASALGAVLLLAWARRRRRRGEVLLPPHLASPPPSMKTQRLSALSGGTDAADTSFRNEVTTTPIAAPSPRKTAAAGHEGNLEMDGMFYKLENVATPSRYENELAMLQRLLKGDPMTSCAPTFHGVVTIDGKRYLKMRSVLAAFDAASLCVMDVKMGVRCFAESELSSKKPRGDLFERLKKMQPSALTAEEQAAQTITKARWMKVRDSLSSTQDLGFRVDGINTPTTKRKSGGDLALVRGEADILVALRDFLPKEAAAAAAARLGIQARLAEISDALARSELFASHEIIGSSLLFAADGSGKSGVWMIDFGLTVPSPVGQLRHTVPWEYGNHEDGYLFGLANIQRLWGELIKEAA